LDKETELKRIKLSFIVIILLVSCNNQEKQIFELNDLSIEFVGYIVETDNRIVLTSKGDNLVQMSLTTIYKDVPNSKEMDLFVESWNKAYDKDMLINDYYFCEYKLSGKIITEEVQIDYEKLKEFDLTNHQAIVFGVNESLDSNYKISKTELIKVLIEYGFQEIK
jgi:uncharacterized lipoprotein YehR (DUF1307 family)